MLKSNEISTTCTAFRNTKMFSHDLKKWKIFNTLEPTFMFQIYMAIVYGDSGEKALIVTKEDEVYALGNNTHDLKAGVIHRAFSPVRVEELCQKKIKTFACGKDHVLALTEQGQVYLWEYIKQHLNQSSGYYSYNQQSNSNTSVIIPSIKRVSSNITKYLFFVDIACGINHSLALTDKGEICVWEYVKDQGATEKKYSLPDQQIICVACGKEFSMVVTYKGEVHGWGENSVGQIGTGDYSDVKSPLKVAALNDVVIEKIVCGYTHTLALSTTGILYAWGGNISGQLGLGVVNHSIPNPTKLEAGEMGKVWDVAALNCSNISVAMGEGNRVFIWGQCLGQNVVTPRCTPLRCLHDAFAYCAWPRVTYQPLVFFKGRSSNLTKSLGKAFNDQLTSDFIIKVQEKPIYVHKTILIIRCQHFRTMFDGRWAESNENNKSINEFSYEVYKAFLEYLYTDAICLSSIDDLVELLEIANMYFVNQLKRLCEEMLIENITLENVVFLYKTSFTFKAKELERCCFQLALNHMTAVVQIPEFLELDRVILKKFLIKAAEAGAFKT